MERKATPKQQRSAWKIEERDSQYKDKHNLSDTEYKQIIDLHSEAISNGFNSILDYLSSCYHQATESKKSNQEGFNAFDQIAKGWKESGFAEVIKRIVNGNGRFD